MWISAIRRASRLDVTPGTIGICQNAQAASEPHPEKSAEAFEWQKYTIEGDTHRAREELEAGIEVEVFGLEEVAAGGLPGQDDDGGLRPNSGGLAELIQRRYRTPAPPAATASPTRLASDNARGLRYTFMGGAQWGWHTYTQQAELEYGLSGQLEALVDEIKPSVEEWKDVAERGSR